jgi:hypothetical protein
MAVVATLTRTRPTVSVKVNQEGVIRSNAPVTIKSSIETKTNRLDSLEDVVEQAASISNGHTLVYNSDTDKYVVKALDLGDVSGTLDGGTF